MPVWMDAVLVMALGVAVAVAALDGWQTDLHAPLSNLSDASYYDFIIKTVVDHGWYTQNPDVGAPFGATLYDFPIPEPTHLAFIRMLGWFSKDPFFCFNLFYLFSFAGTGLAAWWSLGRLGMERPLAIAGALLFSMLPYHFFRVAHLFLASYFAVPIFAALALELALYHDGKAPELRLPLLAMLLLAIAAGGGIYYAFFGCIFIAAGAALGAVQSKRRKPLTTGAVYIAVVVAVVGMSLVPNALFHVAEGANPQLHSATPARRKSTDCASRNSCFRRSNIASTAWLRSRASTMSMLRSSTKTASRRSASWQASA